MKTLIVYNKTSGRKGLFDLANLAQIKLEKQNHQVQVFELSDWSGKIFDKYKNEKFDLVVAIGGDGTIRTCANLILKHMPMAKLKIIPAGSSNVLAHGLKMNSSTYFNINRLSKVDKLIERKIDVGFLNNQEYFLGSIIMGHTADVIAKTKQKHKNSLGFWAYVFNFFKHRQPKVSEYELVVDKQLRKIKASTLIIANTLNLFGFSPPTKADLTDNKFEIFYMTYNNFFKFIFSVVDLFLTKSKTFVAEKIELQKSNGQKLVNLHLDGDLVATQPDKLKIEVLYKALTVVI